MIITTEVPKFEFGIYCIYGKQWRGTVRAVNRIWDQLTKPDKNQKPPFEDRPAVVMFEGNLRLGVLMGDRLHQEDVERTFESIFAEYKTTRWVISTMHPWVVDRIPLGSCEDVQDRLFAATDEGHLLRMTDADARIVWDAYSVGIQTLSEILLTHGYW